MLRRYHCYTCLSPEICSLRSGWSRKCFNASVGFGTRACKLELTQQGPPHTFVCSHPNTLITTQKLASPLPEILSRSHPCVYSCNLSATSSIFFFADTVDGGVPHLGLRNTKRLPRKPPHLVPYGNAPTGVRLVWNSPLHCKSLHLDWKWICFKSIFGAQARRVLSWPHTFLFSPRFLAIQNRPWVLQPAYTVIKSGSGPLRVTLHDTARPSAVAATDCTVSWAWRRRTTVKHRVVPWSVHFTHNQLIVQFCYLFQISILLLAADLMTWEALQLFEKAPNLEDLDKHGKGAFKI